MSGEFDVWGGIWFGCVLLGEEGLFCVGVIFYKIILGLKVDLLCCFYIIIGCLEFWCSGCVYEE